MRRNFDSMPWIPPADAAQGAALSSGDSLPRLADNLEVDFLIDLVFGELELDVLGNGGVDALQQTVGVADVVFARRIPPGSNRMQLAQLLSLLIEAGARFLLDPRSAVHIRVPTNVEVVAVAVHLDKSDGATKSGNELLALLRSPRHPSTRFVRTQLESVLGALF